MVRGKFDSTVNVPTDIDQFYYSLFLHSSEHVLYAHAGFTCSVHYWKNDHCYWNHVHVIVSEAPALYWSKQTIFQVTRSAWL